MQPCESCSVGKTKQKNASNNSDHKPAKVNPEQIFIDISSVKGKKRMDNQSNQNDTGVL